MESLFIGVIELADMTMVSSLGLAAVAAVGVTSQPRRILLMFILALNVGATALVSRRIGENRPEDANHCMHQFLLLSILLSFVLYLCGFLFARPFMLISGADAEYLDDAVIYFRVIVVGQFLQAISLTVNSCLRAAGKTRVTFHTNVAANLVNLTFNYFLIYGKCGFPRLEIEGAAIATSLGCLTALLISLWSVRKQAGGVLFLQIKKSYWTWDSTMIKGIAPVINSAFQEQLFQRLGLFIYARLAASLGTDAFALYNFIMNIANLQGYTYDGFAVTATSLTGQNLGAQDPDRAEQSTKITLRMSYWTAAVITVLLILGRPLILGIFSHESCIVLEGSRLMLFVAISCIPCAGSATYAGALRGAGETKPVARYTLFSTAIFRPALAWLLCYPFHMYQLGVWIAFFSGHTIRWLLMLHRYQKGTWRNIKL